MKLNRYSVVCREFPEITRAITAKNEAQAWSKFVTLYFGGLKPAREDFRIYQVEAITI